MKSKIKGKKIGRMFSKEISLFNNIDYAMSIDGLTFGIKNGKPFHTFNFKATTAEILNWAEANANYFEEYGKRLRYFAHVLRNENIGKITVESEK
jgi:hypothetical protein